MSLHVKRFTLGQLRVEPKRTMIRGMFATPVLRLGPRRVSRGLLGRVVVGHWMGELGLFASTLIPCVVLLALWFLSTHSFGYSSLVWHHQRTAILLLILMTSLTSGSVWGFVGLARCVARKEDIGTNRVLTRGASAVVFSCILLTVSEFAFDGGRWIKTLCRTALDRDPHAVVLVDTAAGRLFLTGRFAFGTASLVNSALRESPSIHTVELESPGGFALEGLALAKVLKDRQVDTVVMKWCASACITAFAAGEHRILGPTGILALHSTERLDGEESSQFDAAQAELLRQQGVADWLIHGEANTPFEDSWKPGPNMLLGSGLVTELLPRR